MKIQKKIRLILPYLFLGFLVVIGILLRPLDNLDELWNYNFAKNIYEGRVPYQDFNMVPTPLSAYLAAFFLKIFGNSLFVFRILGVLLAFSLGVLFWKISESLLENCAISFCAAVYMILLHLPYMTYDYNYLNLLNLLIVLFLEDKIKKIDQGKAEDGKGIFWGILIGFMVGLTPLVKQSTGIFLFLANLILCGMDCWSDKKNKKAAFMRVFASMIPGALFFIFLMLNHNLMDFWDYAVCGLASFDNKKSYISFMLSSPLSFALGILPFVILGFSTRRIIKEMRSKRKRFQMALFFMSAAGLSVAFPITDAVHFFIALMPFPVLLFAHMNPVNISKGKGMFCCIFVAIISSFVVYFTVPVHVGKSSSLNHFTNIPIQEEIEQQIIRVENYICEMRRRGQEVYIADASAAVYMIPLDLYHKDFDMLSKGNTGSQSVRQLLSGTENALFLIAKDSSNWNWQTNLELLYYIKENYQLVGEVEQFDVYRAEK